MHKILVTGKGGREHAIAWKLAQSPLVSKVFVAPGNAAIDNDKITSINISNLDFKALADFAIANEIFLTIAGTEAELAGGISDYFKIHSLDVFGPSQYCAQIESSKDFAKQLMASYDIPTAAYQTFDNLELASEYVKKQSLPIVIKQDGLAAGKGVTIAYSLDEAIATLTNIYFQNANGKVVIEEFMHGEEFTLLALVSGTNIVFLQIAQDHKRAFDNDQGENTGGMGAYTPVHHIDTSVIQAAKEIVKKMVNGLAKDKNPYEGIIYAGLMVTPNGVKVVEFNARFGDPETEVILAALKDDLLQAILDVKAQKNIKLTWHQEVFLGVVLAAKGYPSNYNKGELITIRKLTPGVKLFHMGTKQQAGKLVADGGRVVILVGQGQTVADAQQVVYENIKNISCKNLFYRHDIGNKAKQ